MLPPYYTHSIASYAIPGTAQGSKRLQMNVTCGESGAREISCGILHSFVSCRQAGADLCDAAAKPSIRRACNSIPCQVPIGMLKSSVFPSSIKVS